MTDAPALAAREGRATGFTSALIRGEVVHARRDVHAQRTFRYPVYVAAIDLDELPDLERELALFSRRRPNLFGLDEHDYAAGGRDLRATHAELLARHGLSRPERVVLVTNLRVFGYTFNPVSFFLGYTADGSLASVVAEVNNTYGGRHAYVLGPGQRVVGPAAVTYRVPRELFVSPFLHGHATYDFAFEAPLGGGLAITMHVATLAGDRVFTASLRGERRALSDAALLRAAVRYPFMTAQVIGLIHYEALKLHWRRVPFRRPGADHRPIVEPVNITTAPKGSKVRSVRHNSVVSNVHAAHAHPAATSTGGPPPAPAPRERPAVELVERATRMTRRALGLFRHAATSLERAAALRVLQAGWTGGGIVLELPTGERVGIGDRARGSQPVVRVRDERMFRRLLLRGELGAGEAFTAGDWEADDLVEVCRTFLRGTQARGAESLLSKVARLPTWWQHQRAANTVAGSRKNIAAHYDLGNDFYQAFLDEETLAYSCAVWPPGREAATLSEAQRAKYERLCEWMGLSARDHLLEIGCGWGGMAIYAAATRGCRVTAITVSREQHALAKQRVAEAGLAERVSIELRDYRTLTGTFDHVVSIEMLEAVGEAFLPTYFERVAQVLRPGGRFALQSITMPDERFESYRRGVDWMQTYIFPGSLIPSLGVIEQHASAAGLHETERDDIGPQYARTLRQWRERFEAAVKTQPAWARDPEFVRTWLLYLAFSEAAFAERTLGDHQLVFVRK